MGQLICYYIYRKERNDKLDYLAHKRNETDGKEELLIDHLTVTAEMAKLFAKPFDYGDLMYFIGLIHDIGKYSKEFQQRIRGMNNTVDHSTAGTQLAFTKYRAIMSAFCIAGHHAGIPNLGSKTDGNDSGTLWKKVNNNSIPDYSQWKNELVDLQKYAVAEKVPKDKYSTSFLIHMLFSCLVDADYICTENFMVDDNVDRGVYDTIPTLLERLNQYVAKWGEPKSKLNILRTEIQKQCINAKNINENLLTLTVPTGGGKTISSLAFALNYAVQEEHKRDRIIYVIPYTSIIEQNAEVFKNVLGEENVIEHHSNVDFGDDTSELIKKKQLACENWDAPVIVTTSVQFFESLYSNKPSRNRKLHNIANSIIIFDEAQMIPRDFIEPCINAINQLTENYNATAVLCTATQPNLDYFFSKIKNIDGYTIPEICSENQEKYFEEFRRVKFVYDGKLEDDELVEQLRSQEQVLCIVNKKSHADSLFNLLGEDEGNFCLTTHKYPKHRKAQLKEIRERLAKGLPCRVISTSLIEAGVDLDFKTVYRAIAGVDSILQAGGRCNRENKRSKEESIVHIFDTDKILRLQEKNIGVTRKVLKKYGGKIYTADAIKYYFDKLYYLGSGVKNNTFDIKEIIKNCNAFDFKTVSDDFKLIEDNAKTVYIDNEDSRPLITELRNHNYSKALFRKLGQYAVNLYDNEYQQLDNVSAIEIIDNDFYVMTNSDYYNENIGIALPDENLGNALMV